MSRDQFRGHCDKCSHSFSYALINNGFNDSSYAYCDSCGYVALLDHWKMPKDLNLAAGAAPDKRTT